MGKSGQVKRFQSLRRFYGESYDVIHRWHGRIERKVLRLALLSALIFALPSLCFAQETHLQSLLSSYAKFQTRLEQAAGDKDDDKRKQDIKQFNALEDELLSAARQARLPARQRALLTIANARFSLDH
jgi:hypothetical protein